MRKYEAFYTQKGNSKKRNIEFNFTYDEWVRWWEQQLGPNWAKIRGCKRGQYVMARFDDAGPYQLDNVKCITHNENVKEGTFFEVRKNRTKKQRLRIVKPKIRRPVKGRKLTAEQAISIFNTIDTQRALAKKYAVSERLVRLIKNKEVWGSVTEPHCC